MALTGNLVFFNKNFADAAVVTPDAAPPAANPVSNLTTELPRNTWRSTGLVNTGLVFDMGVDIPDVNAVCLIRHNASLAATFDIFGHATNIFPGGFAGASFQLLANDFYPSFFGAGEGGAGQGGAGGAPLLEDLPLFSKTVFKTFVQQTGLRYWYLKPNDSANAEGFVEMGRFFLGFAFQPTLNFNFGAGFGVVDPSVQVQTKGGGIITNIRTKFREKSVTLPFVPDSEKYFDFFNMQKTIGKTGNLVIAFNPNENESGFLFETIYGKFARFPVMKEAARDANNVQFTFRELV